MSHFPMTDSTAFQQINKPMHDCALITPSLFYERKCQILSFDSLRSLSGAVQEQFLTLERSSRGLLHTAPDATADPSRAAIQILPG